MVVFLIQAVQNFTEFQLKLSYVKNDFFIKWQKDKYLLFRTKAKNLHVDENLLSYLKEQKSENLRFSNSLFWSKVMNRHERGAESPTFMTFHDF